MNNPLVSVIIPSYNVQDYLKGTIDSVTASTYRNIEIIVVDDASQDDSLMVAHQCATADARITVLPQSHAGVCTARNRGVSHAHGEFILPLDGDDLISCDFIAEAVARFRAEPDAMVIAPSAQFFGERTGEWKLPDFSLEKLAHHNLLASCAMYRKSDFERCGGYCTEMIAREDWDFWIAMLKDGGKVVRLNSIGFYYRIRKNSKRIQDRAFKRQVVDMLNARHSEFFQQYLNGPLRYHQSWSKTINRFCKLFNPNRY